MKLRKKSYDGAYFIGQSMKDTHVVAENHRRVIGVVAPFDISALRKSYLRLIKANHPDLFYADASKYAVATEKTKQINLSFQFLSEYLEKLGGIYSFPAPLGNDINQPSREDRRTTSHQPRYTYEGERYTTGFPDRTIIEIFLKSSHIISTGYDRAQSLLYFKFKGNRVYRYLGVSETVFNAFLAADSHGKFAHKYIYQSFPYESL